jgi:hypothetical protein
MSIKKFAVAATAVLHLRDANDELMYKDGDDGQPDLTKPMRVHLYGPGSKQFAKASARNSNLNVERIKKKGKADQTAEEKTQETAEFLTTCTAKFENIEFEELQGEFLHKAVYSYLPLGFVAKQVNEFLGDWGNFTTASTTKPASTSGTVPG